MNPVQIRRQQNSETFFRSIPSSTPIKSPSPDSKRRNIITPTISPDANEIQRQLTPLRNNTKNESFIAMKNNQSNRRGDQTETKKYFTQGAYMQYAEGGVVRSYQRSYEEVLGEKEEIIRQLKRVIRVLTQGKRTGGQDQGNQEVFRDLTAQVKVLTIENQKLLGIIDKGVKMDSSTTPNRRHFEQFKNQILELQQAISINQTKHEGEMDTLMKSHKSLAIHCKDLQTSNKRLQQQNQRLMRLLKEKDQSERKLYRQKMAITNLDIHGRKSSDGSQKSQNGQRGQKFSITKIKEQYHQNLKAFKEGAYHEVDNMYDTIQETLQQINYKIQGYEERIEHLERVCSEQRLAMESSRSDDKMGSTQERTRGEHRKSEIYIEEGPSSSSDREDKILKGDDQQLSRVLEESRRENSRLQDQLNTIKSELQQLRFKYDKMCIDTSVTPYSKRSDEQGQRFQKIQYDDTLQSKDFEITRLREQLLLLMEQKESTINFTTRSKDQQIGHLQEQYNQKLNEVTLFKDKEMEELRAETEAKVQELMSTFEKEVDILKQDLYVKKNSLARLSEVHGHKESEYVSQIITLKQLLVNADQKFKMEKDQYQETILNEQKSLNDLSSQNFMLKTKNNQLQKDLLKLREERDQIKTDRDSLETQFKKVTQKHIGDQIEVQKLRTDLSKLVQKQQGDIDRLAKKIQQKDTIIQKLQQSQKQIYQEKELEAKKHQQQFSQLNIRLKKLKRQSLVSELNQIRKLIDVEKFSKIERELNELSTLYEKSMSSIQQKVQEVSKTSQENLNLSEKLMRSEQTHIQLQQKVRFLQGSICIYQKELKDRKQLCESLIEQKYSTEQEMLALKTIKEESKEERVEIKNRTFMITQKIDNLLEWQRQRDAQLQEIVDLEILQQDY